MLSPLRYFLTLILVILLSGSSSAFVLLNQSASFTEQNEKIETENFVDEAIPSSRSKKQLPKFYNPFLKDIAARQNTVFQAINAPQSFGESNLFIKYRKLLI